MAHFFEVVVTHIVNAEGKAVLILRNALANVGEELVLLLSGLLGHLREVVDLGAF